MSTKKPEWMSEEVYKHIATLLSEPVFVPTLTLKSVMDEIFQEDKWWDYEYETILETLKRYGLPLPSVYLLGQIQCISAVIKGDSFIDKEWHLFEKAVLALTGIPVLFFDKQNVPIEAVYHAVKIMNRIGKTEFSEEVLHYIGCEAINDEILWHSTEFIDKEILNSLSRLHQILGLSSSEISAIRSATKARFNSLMEADLEKESLKEDKVEDVMCMALLRSLLIGKDMEQREDAFLSKFLAVKDGSSLHEETPLRIYDMDTRSTEETVLTTEETPLKIYDMDTSSTEDFQYDPDIENVEDVGINVLTFGDGVREGEMEYQEKISELFKDASRLPGVPIDTGVPMSGQEDDTEGPSHSLEKTPPLQGDAEEKMTEFKSKSINDNEGTTEHEVVDPSIAFEL